jgi:hypothetical protein
MSDTRVGPYALPDSHRSAGAGLRRFCLWGGLGAGTLYFALVLLLFTVEPPHWRYGVSTFQHFCLYSMIPAIFVWGLTLIASLVGVCIRGMRRQMLLPLVVNLGLLVLSMLVNLVLEAQVKRPR